MKILKNKLTWWAGLSALVLSITACGPGGGPAPNMAADRPCPFIQNQNAMGNDRFINIKYDQDDKRLYVPIREKLTYFVKGNVLIWKADQNQVDEYAIEFGEFLGCTNHAKASKNGPCKDNPGGWEDGKSEADGNRPIVCNTRDNAVPKNPLKIWDYCYKITAKTGSDLKIVDPVGGGSGCSGCHGSMNSL